MTDLPTRLAGLGFRRAWCIDFEFRDTDGNAPTLVCLSAKCLLSGAVVELWENELQHCPFDADATLFIAYFASAEMGCFEALGWPRPRCLIDLYAEFRRITNNGTHDDDDNGLLIDLDVEARRGSKQRHRLIDALDHFSLPTIGADDKRAMIDRILRGPPWSAEDRQDILAYCAGDVDALLRLAPVLLHSERYRTDDDLRRALNRGRYLVAVGVMENIGTPIDKPLLDRLLQHWEAIKLNLIKVIDPLYGVYDDTSFRTALFEKYLEKEGIAWPRDKRGRLVTNDEVFRQMANIHVQLSSLRELRHTLGQLRLNKLTVGRDGRNRTLLSPFAAKTGRNQPSSNAFIFGQSVWLRGLIKPAEGMAVAYIDWSAQEIAIAAALSGDANLWQAYRSGDPYIDFAIRAGLVPNDATKQSHRREREACKQLFLGIGYGMTEEGIAARAGLPVAGARRLIDHHRRTYPVFWEWTKANVTRALLGKSLRTVYDWQIHFPSDATRRVNPRSIMNWPMQANGAEMMRLAACLAIESGLRICAPVHDAFLLEAPIDAIEEKAARLADLMGDASELVMGDGRRCRCGQEIVRWPGRYRDGGGRGTLMFRRVMRLLDEIERREAMASAELGALGRSPPNGGMGAP